MGSLLTRARAARLLEQYLDGQIIARQAKADWPESDVEDTLSKLGRVIFPVLRKGKLTENFSLGSRQNIRLVVDRCILLLRSDRPYLWGDLSGLRSIALLSWVALCLVIWLIVCPLFHRSGPLFTFFWILILFVGAWIVRARLVRPVSLESLVEGNWKYWPFDGQDDWEATLQGTSPPSLPGETGL
ncbi:MAG: hypothetical protein KAV00_02800 [Phycisphaerae bacterium]|nr:hypothetical protein [Phycisphaerae bacterium]